MASKWISSGRLVFASALLTMGALPAVAHHTFAMFDGTRKLELRGTVKELQWTNPHCFLQLLVTRDGAVQEWSLQMNAPLDLYRNGWRPRSLKPGDQVTVLINPARAGRNSGRFISGVGPDGKKLSSG
ncbi:MAG TPA: DUF6152 family protein [Steroidobacteraceae bacterium]|nr:DUF6152 family protein [Steroidobacteraceae bacterium]